MTEVFADFFVFMSVWMGAATASLLGVVADRGSWRAAATGRSHCVCGQPVGPVALVPVLGWLVFAGRARCCGSRIPGRYPLAEVALATVWGGSAIVAVTGQWLPTQWLVSSCAVLFVVSGAVGLRVLRRASASSH